MSKKTSNPPPWQAIEEQAYHAYREWPIWLALREREPAPMVLLVLRVRRTVLMPIVFLLCTVGAFASASRLFDVYVMLAIGVGAFFLRRRGYEMAPLVLGLVLGPLLDKSLRRGLVLSDGSLLPFFTRPISMGFAAVTI